MTETLNLDALERRIGVHDGLNIIEAMDLLARIRDLEADRDSWSDQASERVKDAVEALERIRALEAENAKLRESGNAHHAALQRIGTALDLPAGADLHRACVSAIASLRAEAARYRWLRDSSVAQWEHPIVVSQHRMDNRIAYVGPLIREELDAAIDAAMSATASGKEEA